MNRLTTIILAVALVVSLAAMPLGAAGALANEQNQSDDESIAPGEQLTGAIGVQEAELQGELSERTYGIALANAQSDDERADVVEKQFADAEERFAEHEERLEALEEARESGEISEGQYRAEVATIAAETATVERVAGDASATAGELNESVLEDRGINASAIAELRTNAAELGGGDVAAIAQSIAGDSVGQSPFADREPGAPIDTPGTDRGNDAPQQNETAPDRDADDGSAGEDADETNSTDNANVTDEPESGSDDSETANEAEHEETDSHSGDE
ncbi:putative sodium/potassium/calcium exchanger [Natronorubrum texcoconense]|uniref:Uncharacterized protein n=1 Tax=Natronorubrum texcoconense TaxID=1095776 RepID=A0A1G8ULA6_9EURY|nr:hypothetical protein [Natronorubrum texcoconense]SDJ53925.1 hypothetical protein SAMN04515672_0914 [Natronorubrum texcoconense]